MFFPECIAAARNMSQSNRAGSISTISASNMCLTSQHVIIDADSLHNRYMELPRAGAVNHGEEDHLVTKLCEVLKYHLCQKCYDLVQASATDLLLLSYRSDATSLKCHVQAGASVSEETSVPRGKDLIDYFFISTILVKSITSSGREYCNYN